MKLKKKKAAGPTDSLCILDFTIYLEHPSEVTYSFPVPGDIIFYTIAIVWFSVLKTEKKITRCLNRIKFRQRPSIPCYQVNEKGKHNRIHSS